MTQRAQEIIILLVFGIISITLTCVLTKDAVQRADHILETQENIEVLLQHPNGTSARRILGKPDPIEVRVVK